jgi:hypothetical protein
VGESEVTAEQVLNHIEKKVLDRYFKAQINMAVELAYQIDLLRNRIKREVKK